MPLTIKNNRFALEIILPCSIPECSVKGPDEVFQRGQNDRPAGGLIYALITAPNSPLIILLHLAFRDVFTRSTGHCASLGIRIDYMIGALKLHDSISMLRFEGYEWLAMKGEGEGDRAFLRLLK